MKKNNLSYITLVLVGVIWGSTWMATKVAMQELPILLLLGLRYLLAGGLLLAFFLLKGERVPGRGTLLQLSAGGMLMFVLNGTLSSWSLRYIPSHTAALIGSMAPLFISVMQVPSFHIGTRQHASMLLCVIGAGILMGKLETVQEGTITGYLLALLAVISWCAGIVLMQRRQHTLNIYYAVGWQMFISGILLSTAAAIHGELPALLQIKTQSVLALSYLVIPGSVIAFIALRYTYLKLPAGIASSYEYLSILVATIAGVLLLKEEITGRAIAGSVVILAGIWLIKKYDTNYSNGL